MSMFKKMTIRLSHVCCEGYEVGSEHPHFMIPLTGHSATPAAAAAGAAAAAADVFSRMHDDIRGEWVYTHALSPELLASPEFKDAAREAVRAFKERITRSPGQEVPDVTGTACYVLRWEGDDQ